MMSFNKYIYLIINTLTNCYCLEVSFTVGSDCVEACELTGFFTIRVFRERHFYRCIVAATLFLSTCLNYLYFRTIVLPYLRLFRRVRPILLFQEMQVVRRIFTRAAANYFLSNLIEFFK